MRQKAALTEEKSQRTTYPIWDIFHGITDVVGAFPSKILTGKHITSEGCWDATNNIFSGRQTFALTYILYYDEGAYKKDIHNSLFNFMPNTAWSIMKHKTLKKCNYTMLHKINPGEIKILNWKKLFFFGYSQMSVYIPLK